MNGEIERFERELRIAGISPAESARLKALYARALQRRSDADWSAVYSGLYRALIALSRSGNAGRTQVQRAARTSLERLVSDDFGSRLFSENELALVMDQRRDGDDEFERDQRDDNELEKLVTLAAGLIA